jgi:hypothetical protein
MTTEYQHTLIILKFGLQQYQQDRPCEFMEWEKMYLMNIRVYKFVRYSISNLSFFIVLDPACRWHALTFGGLWMKGIAFEGHV